MFLVHVFGWRIKTLCLCLSLVDVLDLLVVIAQYITLFQLDVCFWFSTLLMHTQFMFSGSLIIIFSNQILHKLGVSVIPENNRTRSIIIRTRPELLNNPNGFYISPPKNSNHPIRTRIGIWMPISTFSVYKQTCIAIIYLRAVCITL